MPAIAYFDCSRCHKRCSADAPQTVCPSCSGLLYVRYDLDELEERATRPPCAADPSMWRYANVLPKAGPITLGEGWTPLLLSRRYPGLLIKDEAKNPTGSFEARGMSLAVTMARHYGQKELAVASGADASSALAAYAAAAGIAAHVFMSCDVPLATYLEAIACGAQVIRPDQSANGGDRTIAEVSAREGWFDVTAEPFRIEGSKTIGYELVEQLGWRYPDAILYPTGEGNPLIGMWKAFDEMEQLDWISGPRPKMIAVEASGCSPLARSLRSATADRLMLEIVRESFGTVVEVPDDRLLTSLRDWAKHEGLLLSPVGAAATAAYDQLIAAGFLELNDRAVLINPSSALKHTEAIAEALHVTRPGAKKYPQRTPVGGIITPQ